MLSELTVCHAAAGFVTHPLSASYLAAVALPLTDCTAALLYGCSDVVVPLAKAHGVALYPSIRRALLHGTSTLNVDGVLVVGE